jgi:hypothetical protein
MDGDTVSVHQCPKCELRFTWQTELDAHCRDEHPDFHHDYPTPAHMARHAQPPGLDAAPGRPAT